MGVEEMEESVDVMKFHTDDHCLEFSSRLLLEAAIVDKAGAAVGS